MGLYLFCQHNKVREITDVLISNYNKNTAQTAHKFLKYPNGNFVIPFATNLSHTLWSVLLVIHYTCLKSKLTGMAIGIIESKKIR